MLAIPPMSAVQPLITNISGYRFASLTDLKEWRRQLLECCEQQKLKGTILLSPEGINVFLAGAAESIEIVIGLIQRIPGLEGFRAKYSLSEQQPFTRMLVRLKKEIIAFGVDGVDPATYTSPRLPAATLKQWLDEGRPVRLLDTRNDYEVKLGTFAGALPIGVDHFRDFPEAVNRLPEDWKQAPVVTFCTGGIRCEKAAPYLEMQGFQNVFQLEGGILKYFEEVGGAHYQGECFVFDQRVGVDPSLRETPAAVCFVCQTPLDAEEQHDPRYESGVSCPYCFRSDEEKRREQWHRRQQRLAEVCCPLPGSVPYENRRPFSIKESVDGLTLIEVLCQVFPHIDEQDWQQRLLDGRFIDQKGQVAQATRRVRSGERFEQIMPCAAEPDVATDIRLVYEDEALLVVHKPAPLPMHASGRFNRNTLQHLLNLAYHPESPRPLHRLDANTTGLCLFARTRHVCKLLQQQFLARRVEKIYLARVLGHPQWQELCCDLPVSHEPSQAGARDVDWQEGLSARTDFSVRERRDDGTALIEARLHSGRTNQIRVHLWHLGHPVMGDATYLAGQMRGATQTLDCAAESLCLHAWQLKFWHPMQRREMFFESAAPDWAGI